MQEERCIYHTKVQKRNPGKERVSLGSILAKQDAIQESK